MSDTVKTLEDLLRTTGDMRVRKALEDAVIAVEAKQDIDAELKKLRCTDHGCVFGHSGGMGTNGGCHVYKLDKHELLRLLRAVVLRVRKAVE